MKFFTRKDLVYFIIILLIVVANLFSVIVYINNSENFLSALSSVISIVLSLIAIFYTFISSLSMGKIDDKISEIHRSIQELTNQKNKVIESGNKLLEKVEGMVNLENGKDKDVELFDIKSTIEETIKTMMED